MRKQLSLCTGYLLIYVHYFCSYIRGSRFEKMLISLFIYKWHILNMIEQTMFKFVLCIYHWNIYLQRISNIFWKSVSFTISYWTLNHQAPVFPLDAWILYKLKYKRLNNVNNLNIHTQERNKFLNSNILCSYSQVADICLWNAILIVVLVIYDKQI